MTDRSAIDAKMIKAKEDAAAAVEKTRDQIAPAHESASQQNLAQGANPAQGAKGEVRQR